ncbi:unnamed protein product [Spirodela intermedia]|uniref:4-alpha-glucanotransferase n=1 Tax=Spirodela intermedia TaxID=51605 RepID=A0A7I8IAU0_SPIIN|nr:unnamed protein product [Spirodela intermedia]CAA6654001.1 unnamed protein product [Spirodela intermedia]
MVTSELPPFRSTLKTVTLVFKIPYYTQWGQSLLISGSEPLFGSWDVKRGLLLSPVHKPDDLLWWEKITVASGFRSEYSYYVVNDDRNVLRWEAGRRREVILPEGTQEGVVEIYDLWQAATETLFFRSAFKNVIFAEEWCWNQKKPPNTIVRTLRKKVLPSEKQYGSIVIQFKISCPRIDEGTLVYVTGNASELGHWNAQNGLRLFYVGGSVWQGECMMRKDDFPIKYPFCYSQNRKSGDSLLEIGQNRELKLDLTAGNPPNFVYLSDGSFREIPWRGAGVAVPMFSVRSEDDLGVGEFLDLKLLVDWAVDSGFHLVQLLPVNDTSVHGTWWDSYPYSSLSVFALHPLYLRLEALSQNIPEEVKQEIFIKKEELNGQSVDYEATMATKLFIAKKIFSLEKETILSSSSFLKFFSENKEWLKPYAAFCFLRDFFETSDHSQWGRFSNYSEEKLEKILSKDSLQYDIISFHYYIQFHLHLQLSEAAEYAKKRKVVLKGDLPIGVDRNSVDTWVYPTLFRMNTSTGAPPDFFDKNGQNWGFPTYNWEEMSKDNYAWWRARLTQMAKYFTAYRIDHILGFFRIWELPEHDELEREGIWDFDRLSRPYIRQETLQDKFGTFWPGIIAHFLDENPNHCFQFKDQCNTEKKIVAKVETGTGKSLWLDRKDKILRGLIDLLQNIVLIRDPEDGSKFYPRFNMEDTSSFRDLDEHCKNVMRRLYHDYYFCRQDELWHMLACGEDLGFIPSCVYPVMQELGLIGLRIQRMAAEPGVEFGLPSNYNYMTVCAPSCHDCSTMRAWWEEDEERRFRFYRTVVGSNQAPPSRCIPELAQFILRQHFESPSMWAIFPIQDLLALKEEYTTRPATEETINDPTNPKHYWRFRVHVSLETLLGDEELKGTIKDLVKESGRSYPVRDQVKDHEAGGRTVHSDAECKKQIQNGLVKIPLQVNVQSE